MKIWIVKRFASSGEMLLACDSKAAALEAINRLACDDVCSLTPVRVNTLDDICKSDS